MPDDPDFGTVRLDIGKNLPEQPVSKKPPPKPVLRPAVKPAAPPPAAAKPAAPPSPPTSAKPAPAAAAPPTTLNRPAAEVAKLFPVGEEAAKLLKEGMTVRDFLQTLMNEKLFIDAVRLLGHALPKREAVWWACLSSRAVYGANPPAAAAEAIACAEKWVQDPTEDHRRPAMAAAEKAELGTPGGCAALATFWSGGSLAPPDAPVIPPDEFLTGHGAGCAVLLAAVLTEPAKAPERYVQFLSEGVKVAEGTSRWPGKTGPASRK